MPISKSIKSHTRVDVEYHEVFKVEFLTESDELKVFLKSYSSQSDAESGTPAAWMWECFIGVVLMPNTSLVAIEDCLVSIPTSPLAGGLLIPVETDIEKEARLKWSTIKKFRSIHEFGQFIWDGLAFDSDLTSQSRIQGAAQLAQITLAAGQPFSIDWTLADNTVVTLDANQMISVGLALGNHINACHSKARLLRQQIESATTKEEIEAIVWY